MFLKIAPFDPVVQYVSLPYVSSSLLLCFRLGHFIKSVSRYLAMCERPGLMHVPSCPFCLITSLPALVADSASKKGLRNNKRENVLPRLHVFSFSSPLPFYLRLQSQYHGQLRDFRRLKHVPQLEDGLRLLRAYERVDFTLYYFSLSIAGQSQDSLAGY
jgi:hypothetical protein